MSQTPTRSWRRLALIPATLALCGLALGAAAQGTACVPPQEPTFTVVLPKVTNPPDPHDWNLPPVWGPLSGEVNASDTIIVPNGRPIYAIIVSGYASNVYLDELMVYRFARHLLAQGAYVHWAWWNNLLAPYMERPLHHNQSHPGTSWDLVDFTTPGAAEQKAAPGENYQFLSDAKLLLQAIRDNNPEAVIILVGHSMGGRSVADLANQTDVLIDLVAPIDPVANRTYPWAGLAYQDEPHYNWTRYRATRETFNGYRSVHWQAFPLPGQCVPFGPWRKTYAEAAAGSIGLCFGQVHVHGAPHMTFGSNVINLHHRYQHEAIFPYDFEDTRYFNPDYPFPIGGSQSQAAVVTDDSGSDPGGWPAFGGNACCPSGEGQAWGADGHGEIIGGRGPVPPKPLGYRLRTSPECGDGDPCSWGVVWPARTWSVGGGYNNGNSAFRVQLLKSLETMPWDPQHPTNDGWVHRPINSGLCLVSSGLASKFESMDKPPIPDAGGDQVVRCNDCSTAMVTLDGSSSLDPDGYPLTYSWAGSFGALNGPVVNVALPVGWHCVTLTVEDSVGHIARTYASIHVSDSNSQATPYVSAAGLWKQHAGEFVAHAFDEFLPGIANGTGCLLTSSPLDPVEFELPGGTLTAWATQAGQPYCVITDSGTTPAVSDANIGANSFVTFEFVPPVTAFYTYFGSLAAGESATMTLLDEDLAEVDSFDTLPSSNSSLASGHGFTSAVPISRVEFTTAENGTTLIGAFVGLKSGESSLGTVNLGNYQGPGGSGVIELDFACTFLACAADITGDSQVDVSDLLAVINNWGAGPGSAADVNGDGAVNVQDLLAVIGAWGSCP